MRNKIIKSILVLMSASVLFAGCSKNTSSEKEDVKVNTEKTEGEDTEKTDTEEEAVPEPAQSTLEGVDVFGNMDERILFGNYVDDRYYKFDHLSGDARDMMADKISTEVHTYLSEYKDYDDDETYYRRIAYEPMEIRCGYFWPEIYYDDVSGLFDTYYWYDEDMDYTESCNLNSFKVPGSLLKMCDAYIYEKFDGEKAADIASKLRKLCNMTVMEMTHWSEPDDGFVYYVYKIENNKIKYSPFKWDVETMDIELLPEDEWMEMEFGFRGENLALMIDGYETELSPYMLEYYNDEEGIDYYKINGYADSEQDMMEGISELYISFEKGNKTADFADVSFSDGSRCSSSYCTAEWISNDKLTFKWEGVDYEENIGKRGETPGSITFRYFNTDGLGMDEGFVAEIDGRLYYYTKGDTEFYDSMIMDNLENVSIDEISEDDMKELAKDSGIIVSQLKDGFHLAGISADVNESTGKVTLNNSILFGVDSSELSQEGKDYLDEFLDVYAEIISGQAEEGRVSCVKIVGHTDISGSYEYNQELSEERAESVKEYCLLKHPELTGMLEAIGKSYSEPVYKENGDVDMAASRRVEFKVILDY